MSDTIRVRISVDSQSLDGKLSKLINNSDVMREVHRLLGEQCNKFVPEKTGALRASMNPTPEFVSWSTPYAHYQYEGEVYGPNYPIMREGNIVGWYSRPGVQKYPMGRELGIPGEWKGWHFGYTTLGTHHHWLDEAMKNGGKQEFTKRVNKLLSQKAREIE